MAKENGKLYTHPALKDVQRLAQPEEIAVTRSLANALGEHNITVNAITPGLTDTPPILALFPASILDQQAQARAIEQREPAEDLVGSVLSDDVASIAGQTINVDGGNNFA